VSALPTELAPHLTDIRPVRERLTIQRIIHNRFLRLYRKFDSPHRYAADHDSPSGFPALDNHAPPLNRTAPQQRAGPLAGKSCVLAQDPSGPMYRECRHRELELPLEE